MSWRLEPASGPCTACGGSHCFYWPGEASPKLDGTYEYICPTMGRPSKLRVMGATPENLVPSDWLPVRLAADTASGEEPGGRTKRQRGQ